MSRLRTRTERLTACPLCGGRRLSPYCRSRERIYRLSDQSFAFARCGGCGVVVQSMRPVEADVAAFYPPRYEPYQANPVVRADASSQLRGPHSPLHPGFRRRAAAVALRTVDRLNAALARRHPDPLPGVLESLYAPARPGQVLLDFGCGSAAFLDRARARGWETLGVDFLPDIVESVRQAGHRAHLLSEALWDTIADASIDLVRLNHVIEHLYTPRETLARLRRKLRPGGRLHLATPNAKSVTFRLLRRHWFPLECPRHIVIYTPRSARRLLRSTGFGHVECFQEVLTKDSARSLGLLLEHRGWLDTAAALDLMNRRSLATLLFAPARLAALAGAADRFHAVAS
jgi:2-polyprenyl-3-methyl-5-hydroxy-6-metoxy-1,4-benzoquinol methylase